MKRSWRSRAQTAAFRLRGLLPAGWRRALLQLHQSARRHETLTRGDLAANAAEGRRPLVVLPVIDWETRIQRPQHLLTRLAAAGHPVCFLDTRFVADRNPRYRRLAPGVIGVSVPGRTDFNLYRGTASPEDADRILRALEPAPDLADAVVLVQWPGWWPAANAIAVRTGWQVVYECMDEHAGFAGIPRGIVEQEAPLIERADLVVVTSSALESKCAAFTTRVVRVPNGAEVAHFSGEPLRDPIPRVRGPVVGYHGALAEWFDARLLVEAARRHRDWSFVLIGLEAGADLSPLERFSNVHLLGEKPYAELPDHLHRFDVATIPFRVNDLTRATHPVKLFEYFAAGKPVVSAPLPEVEAFRPQVRIASDPGSFADALEAALDEGGEGSATRRAIAADNSWDRRAADLLRAIENLRRTG